MNSLLTFIKRLVSAFRKDRYLDELREEMEFHVATRIEKYIDSGMTLSEAGTTARREFGNAVLLGERCVRACWIPDVGPQRLLLIGPDPRVVTDVARVLHAVANQLPGPAPARNGRE